MGSRVRLFVSAGPDLEAEREVIGRGVTELPANPGWEIHRTPDPAAVSACHFFILLMGADIQAPVGVELWRARQANRPILALLKKDVVRTPAARVFVRQSQLDWEPFETLTDLRQRVLQALGQHLLDQALTYRLTPAEYEALRAFLAELAGQEAEEAPAERPGGAAGGAVILAPGRDEPREGVLVGEAQRSPEPSEREAT